MSAYDELTAVADNGGVRMEESVLTEKVQESCGYMEGGGWAAETPGARSHTADWLRPNRPSLERENSARSANRRERGWLRRLPTVAQEILSGEELNQGEPSIADGGRTPTLSSLFAYAFPDDDRHQGWLPESARASCRSGGGSRPSRSGVGGIDESSPNNPSSLPLLLPGGGADATMKEKHPVVGITVRRPPSPQFSFMGEDYPPDTSISPATSPKHQTSEGGQQREVQGASCVNGIDPWMDGASQQEDDSALSRRSSEIHFEVDPEIPTSGDAGRMADEEVRISALPRKRRHPAAREATAPRESHRSPSEGWDGSSSATEACFDSRRRRGDRRNGWRSEIVGYTSPSVHDQTAVGDSRLQVDDVSCGERGHMMRKRVEASGATEAGAGDSARCEAEASKRGTGGNWTPAAVAGDCDMSHVEGDGRSGGDSRAALVYDQDVLGGEGAAKAGVGDLEPQTVAGVLGKLRCDENRTVIRSGLVAGSTQHTYKR